MIHKLNVKSECKEVVLKNSVHRPRFHGIFIALVFGDMGLGLYLTQHAPLKGAS
jgi:mannose/fructose/N-acetylgalactosamine-specific phosphotransferase system component IIC